jgi:hypothetical protein
MNNTVFFLSSLTNYKWKEQNSRHQWRSQEILSTGQFSSQSILRRGRAMCNYKVNWARVLQIFLFFQKSMFIEEKPQQQTSVPIFFLLFH